MSYIELRGRWCFIIVLNAHAPTEEKSDVSKDILYEELEQVFDHFPKYYMKILVGGFNAKPGKKDIFKTQLEMRFYIRVKDNSIRMLNFATLKYLFVKSTMLPHRKTQKYTWTSPDGKTHKQINHVLIGDDIPVT